MLEARKIADPSLRTKVVHTLDMPAPFHGDMWPSVFCLMEEVRRHSTVALSGEAADELFCGYRWFYGDGTHEETFLWMAEGPSKMFHGKLLLNSKVLEKLDLDNFVRDSYAQAVTQVPHLPGDVMKTKTGDACRTSTRLCS